ncbi:MAG TPA: DUF4124 domain-containing protein [Rhodanobacteraceae bacterium]|nr:DUF4124 domain-containing protein [Rhodanobacteraceae bacterium]
MLHTSPGNRNSAHVARSAFSRAAFALMLWALAAGGAHAASVYRCVDAHGHLSYQDTACPARAQQSKIDLHPQPLIGAPGGAATRPVSTTRHHGHARSRRRSAHTRHARPVMSWECRAADGEVFYRHTRCPSSIPGDGVVRSRYAGKTSGEHSRRRLNGWSRVRVHGVRVTRAEACRRIHSAGAAGRDGHLRDATVSTYDHLMGRDPCD